MAQYEYRSLQVGTWVHEPARKRHVLHLSIRDSLLDEYVQTDIELGESTSVWETRAGDVVLEYVNTLGREGWQVVSRVGKADDRPRGVYLLGRELPTAGEH